MVAASLSSVGSSSSRDGGTLKSACPGEYLLANRKKFFNLAFRLSRNHDVADDLIGEAAARLTGMTIYAERSVDMYIARTILNLWYDELRRRGCRHEELRSYYDDEGYVHDRSGSYQIGSEDPEFRQVEFKFLLDQIEPALKRLSPDNLALFRLWLEKPAMSSREMGRCLGVSSVGTLRSRQYRTFAIIRRYLIETGNDYLPNR